MREIYLDNAATTRCDEEVVQAVTAAMTGDYGNPSSMHRKGFEAEQLVRTAQKEIAGTLSARPEELIFTSGGTESDNMALTGCARANTRNGKHIITTAIEHSAIAETLRSLNNDGYEITTVPVNEYGIADPAAVADAVRDDTIMVSVMAVNNEIGSVQRLREIGEAIRKKKPGILFHTDAVQAYGKLSVTPGSCGADLISVSGHKFHGPKGTGFLYIRRGVKIRPLIFGGGQQNGLRSGTDNVPGILGLAAAAVRAEASRQEFAGRAAMLRDSFIDEVRARLDDVRINGPAGSMDPDIRQYAAPHIINISVAGVRSEVMLHALEDMGIYVSSGSACSSHSAGKQPGTATLRAIGLEQRYMESAVRISMSRYTTEEEMRECADAICTLAPKLRRFS